MSTLVKGFIAFAAAGFLAGCTTVPPLPSEKWLAIDAVVDRVQCDLFRAFKDNPGLDGKIIDEYHAGVVLTLKVDDNGSVMPDVSLLGPWGAGTYAAQLNGGITSTFARTVYQKFKVKIKDLKEQHKDCPIDPSHPFEDELGLTEWVTTAFNSRTPNDQNNIRSDAFSRLDSIGYTLNFTIGVSAKLNPTFARVRSKGGNGIGAGRTNTHTLEVVMVVADPPAGIPEVCIANPGYEKCTKATSPFSGAPSASEKIDRELFLLRSPLR